MQKKLHIYIFQLQDNFPTSCEPVARELMISLEQIPDATTKTRKHKIHGKNFTKKMPTLDPPTGL